MADGGEGKTARAGRGQMYLDDVEDLVFAVFGPEEREGQVCKLVFERLRRDGIEFESLDLEAVISALNWKGSYELKRAAARALDFLALGRVPVLERRFEFVAAPSDSRSPSLSIEVSEDEIRRAIETQVLVIKATGMESRDFLDRVIVSYRAASTFGGSGRQRTMHQ